MDWSASPPEERDGFRLPENVRHLLASLVGYFSARLELAGLEGKEAFKVYGIIAALVVAALVFLAFGYLLGVLGLIAALAHLTGVHWGWVTLGVSLLHLLGTAVCLLIAKAKWGEPCFTDTFEELRKDQEWLMRSEKPL